MKPTPTAKLERSNDRVYEATTSVVRAVMVLSQGVQSKNASLAGQSSSQSAGGESGSGGRRGSNPSNNTNHLENVKNVGIELRALLAAVDNIVPAFPTATHREVSLFMILNRFKLTRFYIVIQSRFWQQWNRN